MRVAAVFVLITMVTAACGGGRDEDAAPPRSADTAVSAPTPAPSGEPMPEALDSAAAAGPAGAVAVLREYYAAVQAGDFARAYGLWSGEGEASGQTFEAFRSGYAETRSVSLTTGSPGRIEGAAGSRYIEVPVTVAAETSSGERQCFRGTYVLRRSEVTGATADQRAWRIHSASLSDMPVAGCDAADSSPAADSAAAVIRAFGETLASVSVLAPADILRRDIREHYGPLVTSELLEAWLADPSAAPGREVSSPWPDRIEIASMERAGEGRFIAHGTVVYVTSTEAGTDASADRPEATIEVVRTPVGWRISSFAFTAG